MNNDHALHDLYEQTTVFIGRRYHASKLRAVITWNTDPAQWSWDGTRNRYPIEDDPRCFPRLKRRLEELFGDRQVTEDEPARVEVQLHDAQPRIVVHVNHDVNLDLLMGIVDRAKRDWANGLAGHPKVSAQDHETMVQLGIKVRKDGLFGYKRRCQNDACSNLVSTCYANTLLGEAVRGAQKRSHYTCGITCWVAMNGLDEACPDWQGYLEGAGEGSVHARVVETIGGLVYETHPAHEWHESSFSADVAPTRWCKNCGNPPHMVSDPDGPCQTNQLHQDTIDRVHVIAVDDPELWKEWLHALVADNDGDGWGHDAGEVACEV